MANSNLKKVLDSVKKLKVGENLEIKKSDLGETMAHWPDVSKQIASSREKLKCEVSIEDGTDVVKVSFFENPSKGK